MRANTVKARIDHLVVAARTLQEGVVWCETTLGITPGPGGQHPLFGTHNRLLKLEGDGTPAPYLEIIAIDPQAKPTRAAGLGRWFDLDDTRLQARLAVAGPQLVHWVASVPDIDAALVALRGIGVDRGRVVSASRETPHGLLQWRISVRDDGQRLYNGVLPTLIQWGAAHPTQHMPESGLALRQLHLRHGGEPGLHAALCSLGLDDRDASGGVVLSEGLGEAPLGLSAEFETARRGRLSLHACA